MSRAMFSKHRQEIEEYLRGKLLPFWISRCVDEINGGFITHFNEHGYDTGTDEKSLIAQTRCVYTFSSAHRAGYGNGVLAQMATHGVDFLLNKMWDHTHGGFYWMMNRKGEVLIPEKIVYGHSFAIYCLSEYTLATCDDRGVQYAEKTFDLLQKYATDTHYGGYFEMFHQDWQLRGMGAAGGDRKTLDVHMHLMEAYTSLYACTQKEIHRRKLLEIIELLLNKIMHPQYGTGIPQFWANWQVAPQIKFDIVWGWDRFSQDGTKAVAEDNTSYGHNCEFAWLLMHALDVLQLPYEAYREYLEVPFFHAVNFGLDRQFGGVYVEGSHTGQVYDREKEFWQQAEALVGFLDAYRLTQDTRYLNAYQNVHRFVFDKMINHAVGEWYPLMTREGVPIWTHMSHSWKINYHTVRAMVQASHRLKVLSEQ